MAGVVPVLILFMALMIFRPGSPGQSPLARQFAPAEPAVATGTKSSPAVGSTSAAVASRAGNPVMEPTRPDAGRLAMARDDGQMKGVLGPAEPRSAVRHRIPPQPSLTGGYDVLPPPPRDPRHREPATAAMFDELKATSLQSQAKLTELSNSMDHGFRTIEARQQAASADHQRMNRSLDSIASRQTELSRDLQATREDLKHQIEAIGTPRLKPVPGTLPANGPSDRGDSRNPTEDHDVWKLPVVITEPEASESAEPFPDTFLPPLPLGQPDPALDSEANPEFTPGLNLAPQETAVEDLEPDADPAPGSGLEPAPDVPSEAAVSPFGSAPAGLSGVRGNSLPSERTPSFIGNRRFDLHATVLHLSSTNQAMVQPAGIHRVSSQDTEPAATHAERAARLIAQMQQVSTVELVQTSQITLAADSSGTLSIGSLCLHCNTESGLEAGDRLVFRPTGDGTAVQHISVQAESSRQGIQLASLRSGWLDAEPESTWQINEEAQDGMLAVPVRHPSLSRIPLVGISFREDMERRIVQRVVIVTVAERSEPQTSVPSTLAPAGQPAKLPAALLHEAGHRTDIAPISKPAAAANATVPVPAALPAILPARRIIPPSPLPAPVMNPAAAGGIETTSYSTPAPPTVRFSGEPVNQKPSAPAPSSGPRRLPALESMLKPGTRHPESGDGPVPAASSGVAH